MSLSGTTPTLEMPSAVSILVDTSAWYALADTADQHHDAARHYWGATAGRAPFITTDLILAETWALLNAHLGREAAMTFWGTLRETRLPALTVEPVDLEAAWRICQTFSDQRFSFVDGTTFAVMERLGVREAFAFDAHFLVYRFGPDRAHAFRRYP
jgi:predicted nucleic acid-binding protein